MKTPWQKVQRKFGLPAARIADLIGRDRSKVSRHLNDPRGLISGRDQALLLDAAKSEGIVLEPSDFFPEE